MKKIIVILLIAFGIGSVHAQIDSTAIDKEQKVYKYNNKLDIPLTSTAAAISIFNFTQVFSKDRSSEETILALNPDDINSFESSVAGNYSEEAKTASDYFLNASLPLPLLVYALDKDMRKDYLRLTLLYLEAMSFTGLSYSTSQQLNNRLRPLSYNQDLDMTQRTEGRNKNSFFSGHTALVATSTFFLAKTYDDYHPNSGYKWVFYGGAGLATYLTGHLRVRAGQHFHTDVVVGGIVGAASGFLVPYFHKNRLFNNEKLSLMPVTGEFNGLRLSYTF